MEAGREWKDVKLGCATRRLVLDQCILRMRPDGRKRISCKLRILHDERQPKLLRFPRPGELSHISHLVKGKTTYNALFRCAFDSGALLPSPICPGRGRERCGADSASPADAVAGATGVSSSCDNTDESPFSAPPAISSRSFRFIRRLCDLEYGARVSSSPVCA